ncbi:MAG: DUF1036 domain-containing protein [Alphaproteobacteria bacterium]|nr:DUF1036 domain-containing protein [Alphaproteobacteria bacterium]
MKRFWLLVPLVACLYVPGVAHAAFIYCNRYAEPIEAALGYREGGQWVSEGWWRIEPDKCLRVYGPALSARFYFYFARSLGPAHQEWGGKYRFCTDDKPFRIEGDMDCNPRGYLDAGFAQADVGQEKAFTLDFN